MIESEKTNVKCFDLHKRLQVPCDQFKECERYWINCPEELNCAILVANKGPQTLEKVSKVLGLSKTVVGSIEKKALAKLFKRLGKLGICRSMIFDA